jgi:hypothetical protein
MTAREKMLGALQDRASNHIRIEPERPFRSVSGWDLFEDRFHALGGKIAHELGGFMEKRVFVEDALSNLATSNCPLWDAEVSLSFAFGAIAETGSLIVDSRPGCERLSTLVAPVNVIVVKTGSLVETVAQGLKLITDRNAAIVTGPSRTADIEGIMVRGIHGPRELWIYRVESL